MLAFDGGLVGRSGVPVELKFFFLLDLLEKGRVVVSCVK
jgi:hypothetical protein